MSVGCITYWRQILLSHPSFFAESDSSSLPSQILEDPRVIERENEAHDQICSITTPFVATLDEATVNLPSSICTGHSSDNDNFVRLLRPPSAFKNATIMSSYGWKERHAAYEIDAKLCLGPARLIAGDRLGQCPLDASHRLLQRLASVRLEAFPPIRPDRQQCGGDSLFESISMALFGSSIHHVALRRLAVDWMREHLDDYGSFLGRDFDVYLENMSLDATAGDELALRALADGLGVPITVVSGDDSSVWCVRFPPAKTKSKREILLAVSLPAKFSVIRRLSSISRIKMRIQGGLSSARTKEKVAQQGAAIEALDM